MINFDRQDHLLDLDIRVVFVLCIVLDVKLVDNVEKS